MSNQRSIAGIRYLFSARVSIFFILVLFGCTQTEINHASSQFQLLESNQTGLNFNCETSQDSNFNMFTYMYFYNGGGIAVGDYNNDGWEDLFFTSNMSENKLFLNQGAKGELLQFKDVTAVAGLEGLSGWTSGASAVDINNDGLLDIYVSQLGDFATIKGKNQFYICQGIKNGIPIFEDKASELGLDFQRFSTQAAFFDYDLDGDLDMYQMNHSLHLNGTFGQRKSFNDVHPTSGDKLLKNENGKFIDVTFEAGIYSTVIGYGLGIVTGDVNLDGYPDIYIGNDFHENDYLYINQQDGTFKEVITEQTMHTSRFSMGVDMADINNDGWTDIMSLDMMPYDPIILKSSSSEPEYKVYDFKRSFGYHHQFARNNLQLNNGDGSFSEIAMFADVHSTDWSWANLFLDFNHDGNKDIFISNGIPRRMNDLDFINFKANDDIRFKANSNNMENKDLLLTEKMPKIKLPNLFFKNNNDLTFENIEQQISNNQASYSNGSVYADLDNDGDLDVVVNNLEDQPFVYKNLTIEKKDTACNYLSFNFQGTPNNINAIGTKVIIFQNNEIISGAYFPVRGYQSSVQKGVHLGVGAGDDIDSVIVIWTDRTYQRIDNYTLNTTQKISWKTGLPTFDFSSLKKQKVSNVQLKDISDEVGLDYVHDENPFIDFNRERLIPQMVSREGPAVAVGDLNGDGLDDLFLGSGKRRRSQVFLQAKNGQFYNNTSTLIVNDSIYEDVDAVLVDIENDGDLDVVIASGGNEYKANSEYRQQRIYINDGGGNFFNKINFPDTYLTASCVLPTDFNQDGLTDFFFGARAEVWQYGIVPTSYLFQNKGNGEFENVTNKYLGEEGKIGLVKNGNWTDIDQDGDEDLLLALEWSTIQIYLNEGNSFVKKEITDEKGFWNFVFPYDFDQDGDVDIVAGNLGLNNKFKNISKKEPLELYVNDFDDNKQVEQILTYYLDGTKIPFANYQELTTTLPMIKKKYIYSKDLANEKFENIFPKEKINQAVKHEATFCQSVFFENKGNLNFEMQVLPDRLQFSTLNAAALIQSPNEENVNLLLAGNFYENNIEMGRYDADYGNVLSFDKNKKMQVDGIKELNVKGQVRRIEAIKIAGKQCYIIVKNDKAVQIVKVEN
ncbi:MAG: VCBS repeat-containing protein [Saprospiraceae bacterium]